MSAIDSYTLLPNSYVIHLVTTLELNNMAIFYDFHVLDNIDYLFTIFRYKKDYCNYVITLSPRNTASEVKVRFFGVNYDGTLLQTFLMDNTFVAPISIVRSNVSLYWRGEQYSLTFKVPNVNLFSLVKESILNIFTFPNITYITQNDIVINFTLVDEFYFPSYFGQVNYERKKIISKTTWDWCKGVLVGKLNEQVVYFWNSINFVLCNQFPELDDREQFVVIGGVNDYSYNVRDTESIIVKATYANGLVYQADEIIGREINHVPLRRFAPLQDFQIKGQIFPEAYVIAFSNTDTISPFPTYATVGTSSFKDTRRSVQTTNILVTFVQSGNNFQTFFGMQYKYDVENNTLLVVNNQNFRDFLVREKGQIVLSDLIPYDLGSLGKYNPLTNNLTNITKEFQFYDVFFLNIPLEGTFSQEQINHYYNLSGSQKTQIQELLSGMVKSGSSNSRSMIMSGRKSGSSSSDFNLTPQQQQLFNSLSPQQQEECLMYMNEMKKTCGM